MARNRYGWEKRAKEMARKQKNDEKMKRRQGKATAVASEDPEVGEELISNPIDPEGLSVTQDS